MHAFIENMELFLTYIVEICTILNCTLDGKVVRKIDRLAMGNHKRFSAFAARQLRADKAIRRHKRIVLHHLARAFRPVALRPVGHDILRKD